MPWLFAISAAAGLPGGLYLIAAALLLQDCSATPALTLAWRAALTGGGALIVAQAVGILARHPLGLYTFWAANAFSFAVIAWVGSSDHRAQPPIILPSALFTLGLCLYAWLNRAWFRWKGKPGCRLRGEGQGQDGES